MHLPPYSRYYAFGACVVLALLCLGAVVFSDGYWLPLMIFGALSLVGLRDITQTKQAARLDNHDFRINIGMTAVAIKAGVSTSVSVFVTTVARSIIQPACNEVPHSSASSRIRCLRVSPFALAPGFMAAESVNQ